MIASSNSLYSYLEDSSAIRIIRKFKGYDFRGTKFLYKDQAFIVSDNEPALWVHMENLNSGSNLNFKQIIENEHFPIAFALRKDERQKELVYWNYGKKPREKN